MHVHAWALTDVGRKRKLNEDSFLCDDALGLYVVADGMGGHAAGEVASARCVQVVRDEVAAARDVVDAYARQPSEEGAEAVQRLLERAIQKASEEIWHLSQGDDEKAGMGTTCVALLLCGRKGVIGHVGDSRAYLYRQGRVHQLTEDHSLVEEHVKRGLMTRDEAERSAIRNVITRAVGVQESVEVDLLLTDVEPGDLFLLTSDGLTGYLKAPHMLPEMLSHRPLSEVPKVLVDFANDRGGKDNTTVVVVNAGGEGATADISEIDQKAELLRRIPLFQFMSYKELLAMLSIARARRYEPGDTIIRQGETGDEMYVLFRGRVEVQKDGATIAELGAGGHFGEMALVDMAPRSATVIAREPTSAIAMPREALMRLMKKESLLAVKLLWSFVQVLSERLRSSNEAISGLRDEVERLRKEVLGFESVPVPPPPPFGDE